MPEDVISWQICVAKYWHAEVINFSIVYNESFFCGVENKETPRPMPVNNLLCIAAVAVNALSVKVEHSYQFTLVFEFEPIEKSGLNLGSGIVL